MRWVSIRCLYNHNAQGSHAHLCKTCCWLESFLHCVTAVWRDPASAGCNSLSDQLRGQQKSQKLLQLHLCALFTHLDFMFTSNSLKPWYDSWLFSAQSFIKAQRTLGVRDKSLWLSLSAVVKNITKVSCVKESEQHCRNLRFKQLRQDFNQELSIIVQRPLHPWLYMTEDIYYTDTQQLLRYCACHS